jgi:hypothetical protein
MKVEVDSIPNNSPSKKWIFSGFYPFPDKNLISELSKLHNQPIFQIDKNVVGIILPYCHGFDDDESLHYYDMNFHVIKNEFLHIFNYGKRRNNIVGVSKCVKYETGILPSMKRITFALEST